MDPPAADPGPPRVEDDSHLLDTSWMAAAEEMTSGATALPVETATSGAFPSLEDALGAVPDEFEPEPPGEPTLSFDPSATPGLVPSIEAPPPAGDEVPEGREPGLDALLGSSRPVEDPTGGEADLDALTDSFLPRPDPVGAEPPPEPEPEPASAALPTAGIDLLDQVFAEGTAAAEESVGGSAVAPTPEPAPPAGDFDPFAGVQEDPAAQEDGAFGAGDFDPFASVFPDAPSEDTPEEVPPAEDPEDFDPLGAVGSEPDVGPDPGIDFDPLGAVIAAAEVEASPGEDFDPLGGATPEPPPGASFDPLGAAVPDPEPDPFADVLGGAEEPEPAPGSPEVAASGAGLDDPLAGLAESALPSPDSPGAGPPGTDPLQGLGEAALPTGDPLAGLDDGPVSADPLAGLEDTATPVADPLAGLEETATPAADPLAGLEDTATPVADPLAGLGAPADLAEDPLSGFEQPTISAADPLAGLGDSAAPASDPLAGLEDPVAPAADPLAGLESTAAPAADPLAGLEDTAAPATDPLAGFEDPASPAADPLAGLPDTAAPATDPLAGLPDTAAPATDPLAGLGDPAAPADPMAGSGDHATLAVDSPGGLEDAAAVDPLAGIGLDTAADPASPGEDLLDPFAGLEDDPLVADAAADAGEVDASPSAIDALFASADIGEAEVPDEPGIVAESGAEEAAPAGDPPGGSLDLAALARGGSPRPPPRPDEDEEDVMTTIYVPSQVRAAKQDRAISGAGVYLPEEEDDNDVGDLPPAFPDEDDDLAWQVRFHRLFTGVREQASTMTDPDLVEELRRSILEVRGGTAS